MPSIYFVCLFFYSLCVYFCTSLTSTFFQLEYNPLVRRAIFGNNKYTLLDWQHIKHLPMMKNRSILSEAIEIVIQMSFGFSFIAFDAC